MLRRCSFVHYHFVGWSCLCLVSTIPAWKKTFDECQREYSWAVFQVHFINGWDRICEGRQEPVHLKNWHKSWYRQTNLPFAVSVSPLAKGPRFTNPRRTRCTADLFWNLCRRTWTLCLLVSAYRVWPPHFWTVSLHASVCTVTPLSDYFVHNWPTVSGEACM